MTARRILIVDDDPILRQLLRATLAQDEFEISEAADGDEALAAAERARPDVVLLDWRMPGASGAEVLRTLKARDPELPIVVLTADGQKRPKEQAEALGADTFLTKPFSPLELLATLERLLGATDGAA